MNKTQHTSNLFQDQERFMTACDQTVSEYNHPQYQLYKSLIEEEFNELQEAVDKESELDALIDILVVTIGAIHSAGFDGEGAWNEVMRTNFAKIDSVTEKVHKRTDGKVLKPEGWKSPELDQFTTRNK